MSEGLRRHPRFVDAQVVEVLLASRDELRELWSVDISKGGMFVETEEPPPRGARIEIRLETPDGPLSLKAEAVHVVDVATAAAYGQKAGVGVQFIDLTRAMREKIEQYVEGLASKLSTDLALAGTEALDVLLKEAKRVSDAINASDLYGALDLPPSASSEDVVARIEKLCLRFSNPPVDSSPPKAERIRQVARQLERTAPLFKNQRRRIGYDLQRGFVRASARRKAGEDFAVLRSVWSELFPDRIAGAAERHRDAGDLAKVGRYSESVAVISAAIELDPFNIDYAAARDAWQARIEGETAPSREARTTVAAEPSPSASATATPSAASREAARVKNEKGLAHLRRSDFDNARRLLAEAVELDPLPDYKLSSAWAMIADASFDRALAITAARPMLLDVLKVSKEDEDDGRRRIARCHYYLGRLMRDLDKLPAAEKHFAKAVYFDPRLVEASSDLRLIRMRGKRKRGLSDIFKRP